jgi:hypothetical protein
MSIHTHLARREGNALVLAVLLLLTMTSVGLVSVQRTNSDLQVASNVVRASQAQMAGEAGISHSMADVRAHLFDYMFQLRQKTKPELDTKAQSTALTTDDAANIPYVFPSSASASEKEAALLSQSVAYKVDGLGVNEIQDMPGFEVGEMCFEVFDFNSQGGMPTKLGETVDNTLTQTNTVVVRYRARVVVGPNQCLRR